jgi:hypothetical protein
MTAFAGTDRYAIRRLLGAGSSGEVFEAFDQERQCPVALKRFYDHACRDLSLFKQEFRRLAELDHPNLAGLLELASHGSDWFYTMELVPGMDFLEYLQPRGSFPAEPGRLRALFRQLAEGLWALHQAGELHRDLKSSHVRVREDGRVVLLDFGFTQAGGPLLGSSETRAHLAPERIGGLAPSRAGDWYSLGVMLYQALSGAPPFPTEGLSGLIDKLRLEPRPLREVAPAAAPDLAALCMELLARKPERRPDGSEVLARLGGSPEPGLPRPVPSAMPVIRATWLLIGRGAELQALTRAYGRSQQGRALVAFVHGASGMGKHYLLRRFLSAIKREAPLPVILAGRCPEEGIVPYQALNGLMEDLGEYLDGLPRPQAERLLPKDAHCLGRLFPALRQCGPIRAAGRALPAPDPQELRRRAFGALRELLARLGSRSPLVLVIEDLQWMDRDSAALLYHLLREPDAPSLFGLFSHLTGEEPATQTVRAFQERLAEGGAEVVVVPMERLPQEDSRALALALLGPGRADIAAEADWIARESGGNPFFIGELSRHLKTGAAGPGGGERTLDAYLRDQVAALPSTARQVLDTLCLAGHPVAWETIRRACGLEAEQRESLATLRGARLIRARGGDRRLLLEPYHARIRKGVLADLPEDRAQAIHLALAQALEREPRPDAQALSQHYQSAGMEERAGSYALMAAEQAIAALAFDRAVEFYRRALAIQQPTGATFFGLTLSLGDALASAGRGNEAAQVYLRAMPLAQGAEPWRLRRRAAEEYFRSGRFDQGMAALEPVLSSIGVRLAKRPWRAALNLLALRLRLKFRGYRYREVPENRLSKAKLNRVDACWAAAMGLGPVDPVRCEEFHVRHLLLALQAGEPFRLVRALAQETLHCAQRGGRDQKLTHRVQELTTALAERIDHPNPISRALVAAGNAALLQGRWKAAVSQLERAETLLRDNCSGLDFELHQAQFNGLLARLKLGYLHDLESRLAARLEAAQDKGDLLTLTNLKTTLSPQINLAHDEPERALRELRQAIAEWSSAGFHVQHYHALVAEAEVLLYMGARSEAEALLDSRWPVLRRSRLLRVQSHRIAWLELRARVRLGLALAEPAGSAREPALRLAVRDVERLEAERVDYADALALKLRALEALAQDRSDQAGALLFQAEQAFQASEMALHAMVVRLRRSRLEGALGAEQADAADRWMRIQGIANPARYVAMHLPEAMSLSR